MCVCGGVDNHAEIHLVRILTKCGRNFCLFGVCFCAFFVVCLFYLQQSRRLILIGYVGGDHVYF